MRDCGRGEGDGVHLAERVEDVLRALFQASISSEVRIPARPHQGAKSEAEPVNEIFLRRKFCFAFGRKREEPANLSGQIRLFSGVLLPMSSLACFLGGGAFLFW